MLIALKLKKGSLSRFFKTKEGTMVRFLVKEMKHIRFYKLPFKQYFLSSQDLKQAFGSRWFLLIIERRRMLPS